jgi:fatty acid desaturase
MSTSEQRPAGAVFAHDRRDGLLMAVSLFELAGKWTLIVAWNTLSVPMAALSIAGLAVLNAVNYICVAHDFLHLPFFTRRWLNRVWGVVGSLSLGVPITMYRAHHLNHHRFGMDLLDAEIGDTRDWSSIYRHGQPPSQPEPLWRYALLSPLRNSPWPLLADVRRRGETAQLFAEAVALAAVSLALLLLNWRAFLFGYLPVFYFGQVISAAEAYSEHVGAAPGDRRTDSVSCYGRWYNRLCFNNGYHQEHHFRPGVHWTQVPRLKDQMLAETERRVVAGAHFANIFHSRRDGGASPSP